MADALLSPGTGLAMWATGASVVGISARKLRDPETSAALPMMGVMGAFVFAAQMVNFTIPLTGSSGHLGGGLLLAILLGPYAGLIAITSVLIVQALVFLDGGLLALGCNVMNLGVIPCLVVYPLIAPGVRGGTGSRRTAAAIVAGSVLALELGAFGVVLQTTASGRAELAFLPFCAAMLPIHLCIGLVEGAVTAAVVLFVRKAHGDLPEPAGGPGSHRLAVVMGIAALVIGGLVSLLASDNPDGLEWSIARVAGHEELEPPESGVHAGLAAVADSTAVLPEYGFRRESAEPGTPANGDNTAGASLSGVVGGCVTALLIVAVGLLARLSRGIRAQAPEPRVS